MPLARSRWKNVALLMLTAAFAIALSSPAEAKSKTKHHRHTHAARHRPHGAPVASNARYADLVIDARTGRILHATHADQLRHPASLTKMMTLYVTFQALEAGRLQADQYLPVSANAAEQSPSKLGLRPGQSIRVSDAILGLITESANDAAVVLAEALGGSEERFGAMMTKQARALGMSQTVFHNPSGLPNPDQVTTARDMAVLGYALMAHYPRYYPLFSRQSFTYAGVARRNHNHLMKRYEGMDGIKTGYVRASGFNLVSSAVRGNTRLIGVVFGGRSAVARDNQMAQLLDDAFEKARQGSVMTASLAQGDGDDRADNRTISLPAKAAALFPPPGTAKVQQASLRIPELPPAPAALEPPAPTPAPQQVLAPPLPPSAYPAGWSIQIGAYNDPAVAQQALAGIAPRMGQAKPVLQRATSQDGVLLYRARFAGLDQKTAAAHCTALMAQGQSCLVVAPEVGGN